MAFVLDCSATMAWLFEDEARPETEALLNALASGREEALVPALWPAEVANVVLVGFRRKRVPEDKARRFLDLLGQISITVAEEISAPEVFDLGLKTGLTAYDAAYLALARDEGLPLATLDARLAEAARETGIRLLLPPAPRR